MWQSIALVVMTLFANALNAVGGSMMAFVMPPYAAYLLYGTTFLYTIVFLLIAIVQDRDVGGPFGKKARSWNQQRHFLWLALWTALNGLLFQYSDPYVSGPTAQILGNLSIPSVWFFNKFLLHDAATVQENIGTSIVLIGTVIGIIPSLSKDSSGSIESNPWPAVVAFGASAVVQGLEMTFQDRAMRPPNDVRPATALFWYNLYSLFPYMGTIIGEGLDNQVHAVVCALGAPFPADALNGNCRSESWFWPQVFVLGYVGAFFLNALLIRRFNAVWVGVIGTLGAPLSAAVFAVPAIVGNENVVPTEWPVVVASFSVILIGVLIKGIPKESVMEQSLQEAVCAQEA